MELRSECMQPIVKVDLISDLLVAVTTVAGRSLPGTAIIAARLVISRDCWDKPKNAHKVPNWVKKLREGQNNRNEEQGNAAKDHGGSGGGTEFVMSCIMIGEEVGDAESFGDGSELSLVKAGDVSDDYYVQNDMDGVDDYLLHSVVTHVEEAPVVWRRPYVKFYDSDDESTVVDVVVPRSQEESFEVLEDREEDVEDVVEESVQVMGITPRVLFRDDNDEESVTLTEEA